MTQEHSKAARALGQAVAIAPMNRMGSAQEVADACLFLCSSKATFVQGHALVSRGFEADAEINATDKSAGCRWRIRN